LPATLPQKLETILHSSEVQLTEYTLSLTPAKAFNGQLSNFVKNNYNDLFLAIEKLLVMLILRLNVGKNLEPHQLTPLAKKIYSKYYFFSLDEIALVFSKGSSGEFGPLYNKLDEETIMSWFPKYQEIYRDNIVDNYRQQQNNEYEKDNLNEVFSKLGGIDGINKLKDKLSEEDQKQADYEEYRKKYFNI
jgi:hypothetical protein